MSTSTAQSIRNLPHDLQEVIWRKYHRMCIHDMVQHRQRMMTAKLVKEIQVLNQMAEIEEASFVEWYSAEDTIARASDAKTFTDWIDAGSPSFKEWFLGDDSDE